MSLPAEKARIPDTWNTLGMRGTGSHDIALDDVFIPERHTAPVALLAAICETGPWGATLTWFAARRALWDAHPAGRATRGGQVARPPAAAGMRGGITPHALTGSCTRSPPVERRRLDVDRAGGPLGASRRGPRRRSSPARAARWMRPGSTVYCPAAKRATAALVRAPWVTLTHASAACNSAG